MRSCTTGGSVQTIEKRFEAEIEVKKSRFIAIAVPVSRLEEVKENVHVVWEEHPGATHVVHAAVVGKAGTMYSSSDDREPKNTAGRPALEVLKGSGLTNIAVFIVRYFGGTLLGTGGLVKAYSDATKEVLGNVERIELVTPVHFLLVFPYTHFTPIKRVLEKYGVKIEDEKMEDVVTFTCTLDERRFGEFEKEVMDIGQGKTRIEKL